VQGQRSDTFFPFSTCSFVTPHAITTYHAIVITLQHITPFAFYCDNICFLCAHAHTCDIDVEHWYINSSVSHVLDAFLHGILIFVPPPLRLFSARCRLSSRVFPHRASTTPMRSLAHPQVPKGEDSRIPRAPHTEGEEARALRGFRVYGLGLGSRQRGSRREGVGLPTTMVTRSAQRRCVEKNR